MESIGIKLEGISGCSSGTLGYLPFTITDHSFVLYRVVPGITSEEECTNLLHIAFSPNDFDHVKGMVLLNNTPDTLICQIRQFQLVVSSHPGNDKGQTLESMSHEGLHVDFVSTIM